MLGRLKYWILKRYFGDWWANHIPVDRGFSYSPEPGHALLKDRAYWERVASVINNTAFLQELGELQDRYKNTIDALFAGEADFKKIRDLRLVLKGIGLAAGIVRDAHNEVIKLKDKEGR